MDGIELVTSSSHELKSISLDPGERISPAHDEINAHHVEPGPVVAHRGTTSTAKQVQQPRAGHPCHISPSVHAFTHDLSNPGPVAYWTARTCGKPNR